MRASLPLLLAVALASAGCGRRPGGGGGGGYDDDDDDAFRGDGDADADTDADDDTDAGAGADADADADGDGDAQGAPVFLAFGTNVGELTEGQELTVSAVLTDPDGVDDIVGGTLSGEDGTLFGSFATSGQEGAYEADLSWSDLDRVASIEFLEEENRTIVAEFFDQAGHAVRRNVQVRLHCDGRAACGGSCRDLETDETSCGACDTACDAAIAQECVEGRCGGWNDCWEKPAGATCQDRCADFGLRCGDDCPWLGISNLISFDSEEDCLDWRGGTDYDLADHDVCEDVSLAAGQFVRCCCW